MHAVGPKRTRVSWSCIRTRRSPLECLKEYAGKRNRVGCSSGAVHPPPLMPRCATAFNFVIPTGADLDFPASRYCPKRRMRLSVKKAARSSPRPLRWTGNPGQRRGPAGSIGPHANADEGRSWASLPILRDNPAVLTQTPLGPEGMLCIRARL